MLRYLRFRGIVDPASRGIRERARALDFLFVSVGGNAAGGLTPVNYGLDMTSRFVAATGLTHITLDTAIDGFRPEWTIDFTQFYNRDLTAQKGTETGVLTTSQFSENVNLSAPTAGKAPLDRHANPLAIPRFARP